MNITSNTNGIEAINGNDFYHIDRGSLSIIAGPFNCAFYSAGRLVFNANYSACNFNDSKYKSNIELAKAIARLSKKRFF